MVPATWPLVLRSYQLGLRIVTTPVLALELVTGARVLVMLRAKSANLGSTLADAENSKQVPLPVYFSTSAEQNLYSSGNGVLVTVNDGVLQPCEVTSTGGGGGAGGVGSPWRRWRRACGHRQRR